MFWKGGWPVDWRFMEEDDDDDDDNEAFNSNFKTEGRKGPSVLGPRRSPSTISIQPLSVESAGEDRRFKILSSFCGNVLLLATVGISPIYSETDWLAIFGNVTWNIGKEYFKGPRPVIPEK